MIQKGINTIREKGKKSFSILFAGDFCVRSEVALDIFESGRADDIVKNIKSFVRFCCGGINCPV